MAPPLRSLRFPPSPSEGPGLGILGACAVLVGACGNFSRSDTRNGITLSVDGVRGFPYGVELFVELAQPDPVSVRCTADDDPDEQHVFDTESGSDHELMLSGLLAATAYTCTATRTGEAASEGPEVSFTTLDPPKGLPEWTTTGDPEAMVGAYTLFNHMDDGKQAENQKLLVLDPQGRVRWYYEVGDSYAGDVDCRYLDDTMREGGAVLLGGGYGYDPEMVDLLGRVLWQGPEERWHHHVEMLATGEVVGIVDRSDLGPDNDSPGFEVQVVDPATNTAVYSWLSYEAVEQGALYQSDSSTEPFHANSVTFWPPEDGLDAERFYLNLRNDDAIIAVETATGEVQWVMGDGEEFELVDEAGEPLSDEDWFYRQHAPEFTEDSFLLYDNGINRAGGDGYTRVAEYTFDPEERTVALTWTYREDLWLEPYWGDADAIGSDHVLVAVGHCEDCSPIIAENRSALVEIDRATDEVVWRVDFAASGDALYRAQRISGCGIFANAAYCDALRD